MSVKTLDRKIKAATLVPLALLSAAWTANLANISATASDSAPVVTALPDGAELPNEAIQRPASVPIPGHIAAAVPKGTEDSVVSGASMSGIPAAALSAYQRAAQIINVADTTCNIPWELLAAIGRVESNHGQANGNTLGEDGVSRPGVFGITLDGTNGTQKILDTDAGELDGDPVYDRAVGPMQFLPSTWAAVKVDADGDGQRNPQDIDDAALGAAVYLCSGTEDLSSRAGQEASLLRYNPSEAYVKLVLRVMEAYSQGDYTAIPSGTYGGTTFTPSYTAAMDKVEKANQVRKQAEKAQQQEQPAAPATSGQSGTSKVTINSPTQQPKEEPENKPEATEKPAPKNPIETLTEGGKKVTEKVTDTIKAGTEGDIGGVVKGGVETVTEVVTLTVDTALSLCMQVPGLRLFCQPIAKFMANSGMTESDASGFLGQGLDSILNILGLGGRK